MRLARRELFAQAHLQKLRHDGVVCDGHKRRAGARDPERLGTAGKAGFADGIVVGDERAAVGLLQAVVVGGGDKGGVTGFESAGEAGDAPHLPHGRAERHLSWHHLARICGVDLVGRNDGDEAQARGDVVAKTPRQLACGRERAYGRAQDCGRDVVGVALERGGERHEFFAGDSVVGERGGAHDACDYKCRTRAQAACDGHLGLDMNRHGEGHLAPRLKSIEEGLVDHVVGVAELLGAARNGEFAGAVHRDVRIERHRHAKRVVANAEVCARGRNGDLDHGLLLGDGLIPFAARTVLASLCSLRNSLRREYAHRLWRVYRVWAVLPSVFILTGAGSVRLCVRIGNSQPLSEPTATHPNLRH